MVESKMPELICEGKRLEICGQRGRGILGRKNIRSKYIKEEREENA